MSQNNEARAEENDCHLLSSTTRGPETPSWLFHAYIFSFNPLSICFVSRDAIRLLNTECCTAGYSMPAAVLYKQCAFALAPVYKQRCMHAVTPYIPASKKHWEVRKILISPIDKEIVELEKSA